MKEVFKRFALRRILYHIKCGRHSGVKWCCILFYILYYQPLVWLNKHKKYWSKVTQKFHYIPCPFCIKRTKIFKLKKCNCGKIRNNRPWHEVPWKTIWKIK